MWSSFSGVVRRLVLHAFGLVSSVVAAASSGTWRALNGAGASGDAALIGIWRHDPDIAQVVPSTIIDFRQATGDEFSVGSGLDIELLNGAAISWEGSRGLKISGGQAAFDLGMGTHGDRQPGLWLVYAEVEIDEDSADADAYVGAGHVSAAGEIVGGCVRLNGGAGAWGTGLVSGSSAAPGFTTFDTGEVTPTTLNGRLFCCAITVGGGVDKIVRMSGARSDDWGDAPCEAATNGSAVSYRLGTGSANYHAARVWVGADGLGAGTRLDVYVRRLLCVYLPQLDA